MFFFYSDESGISKNVFHASLQKDEVVEVDEETVAILKNSRFAQDFLIGPDGEKFPTCGAYTALEVKVGLAFNSLTSNGEPFKKLLRSPQTAKETNHYSFSWPS